MSTIFDVVVRGQWSEHKIELQVQLAEVDHSTIREYGVDYLFQYNGSKDDFTGGLYPGQVSTPSIPLAIFDGQAVEGVSGAFSWTRD